MNSPDTYLEEKNEKNIIINCFYFEFIFMSYKFFTNNSCEYFPCHDLNEDFNCLFCFCPLYDRDCPGNYTMLENKIKDCSDCTFPHRKENYDTIVDLLKSSS